MIRMEDINTETNMTADEEMLMKAETTMLESDDIANIGEEELYTLDEVKETVDKVIELMTPKLIIDVDSISKMGISEKSFKEGIADGSRIAGMYVTLINAGMLSADAYNICLNESTIRGKIELAKVDKKNHDI